MQDHQLESAVDRTPKERAPHPSVRHAVRIGKILGVPLYVHWSFALLIGLVGLAGPDNLGAMARAAIYLVVIFACVVVHELAHCVIAQRNGLEVRDIVLLPIGGVSEISGLQRATRGEFSIAIAGPATSFGLAIVLGAVGAAVGTSMFPPTLASGPLIARLAWANVVLGVFNLVPAFPLDGGRALRALLARRVGRAEATAIASRVGVGFGYAMIVYGFFANLFVALIGVFVAIAARGEGIDAEIRTRLGDRRIGDLTVPAALVVDAARSADEARAVLEPRPDVSVPVVRDGVYAGMIAARDLGRARTAGDAADADAPLLDPDDDLWPDAVTAFRTSGRGDLAVGRDRRVEGILHRCDVESLIRRSALATSSTA